MNKRNSLFILCLVLVYIFANSCANQGSPTGGPRDTIPPVVINSVPANQSINFNGQTLIFEFDERVTAEKLKQQLIISPNTEIEYNFVTKKYLLTIKLQTPLKDSTTYNFNFLDGVTDITEKNPVRNFRLAFSTGPFIDSIYVSGRAANLLTGEPSKNITIGLYDADDTTNIYEDKPLYFFTADEQGIFKIENIKTGYYNIYAWQDANKNLKLETDQEPYAFLQDTLDLYTSKDSLFLRTLGINVEEPEIASGRIVGRYFDVKFNKSIPTLQVTPKLVDKPLAYQHRIKENMVRFYNTQELTDKDSLIYYFSLTDSLSQSIEDTVVVKFRPTKKKPDPFEIARKTTNDQIRKALQLDLSFNKPIGVFHTDSLVLAIDSIIQLPLTFGINQVDTMSTDSASVMA
ncbi:MAG: Ig-like domain-containing domain, partial [Bacteroidota bacterium]